MAGRDQHNRRRGVAQDGRVLCRRGAHVERHPDAAGQDAGPFRGNHVGAVVEKDGDTSAAGQPESRPEVRHAGGARGEFAVGERGAPTIAVGGGIQGEFDHRDPRGVHR
jgi:hypothetical protein